MTSLIRKEKFTCGNCGTQTRRNNIARHKKSCSAGTLYCTQCPNFSTRSQNDLHYHFAKKHSAPKPDVTIKCKLCYQEFPGFYALRPHRNTQHGMQIGSGKKCGCGTHSERCWGWEVERRVAFLSTLSWWVQNLEWRDIKYSIAQWNLSTKQSWTRNLINFSTIWNVQQKWIWLLVSFWKR